MLIIPLSVSLSGSVNIPFCPWQIPDLKHLLWQLIPQNRSGAVYCTWYRFHSVWLGPYLSVIFWSRIVCERHEGVVVEDDRAPIAQVHVKPRLCKIKHAVVFTLEKRKTKWPLILRTHVLASRFYVWFLEMWTDPNQRRNESLLRLPQRNHWCK